MNASKLLNRLAGCILPAALGLLMLAGSAYAQNVPYSEDFDAATTATFRTVAYRALPDDPTTPMYHALGGASAMTIVDGALNFVGARFTIGNTQPTVVTTPTTAPPGIFDLSQTYTVSFCLVAASGSGNLQVYVDNNTTGQSNSPFGNASRIYNAAVGTLVAGTVISVTSSLGTATSFVYLRTESNANATIDNFRIDYGTSGSATCPSGSSSSSSSESSSSSSESSSSSSESSSSSSESSSSSSSGTSNLPFFENFDAASEGPANGGSPSNLWQAAYRSIPGDPATPMFIATGGGSALIVTPDRSLSLTGARFTIGNTIPLQTSNSTSAPPGIFDLGSQYTISFCVLSTSETGFFYVYIDNNTTTSGNSPLGAASRLVEEPVANMVPGTVYSLTSSVGTPTSFVQLRTNSGTTLVIDNLSIDAGPVGSATCPPPAPVSAFTEDFDAATTATLLTTGYRALPDHPAIPMFHTSATSRTDVINNALSFMGAVFTVGNTTPAVLTTASDTTTSGIFDLSQEYTISFCFVGSDGLDGTRKLQVQIDNNSSSAANSIHGVASRIFNEDVGTLTPQTVYSVTSTVGTPTSIFSLRMENNERIAIDNLTLDYGSVGTATCPPPTSSSSSSSSDGGSSSSNSSSSSDPGGPGTLTCAAANTVPGFASLGNGTTGGEGGREVTVTNGVELVAALATQINNPNPLKIWVDGTITAANSGGASKFDVKDMDNVSIIGLPGSLFDGIGIKIWRANNIIVRNVTMRYVNIGDKDHIGLEGPASNVWIDHNQFYNSLDVHIDFYDELVSGKGNIDNITVSYNYFHDSWKTSLWGSSDSDNFNRRVSFIGNRWERVSSRLPLFRFGEGHVLNNYYSDVRTTGINSRMGARIRVDSSHFEDAINPLISQDSNQVGFWDTNLDNIISNVTWTPLPPNCTANPCSWGGTPGTTQNGGQFPSTVSYVPPYTYTVVPGADVKAHVIANSGVNRIDACLDFPGGSSSSSSSSSEPSEHIFADGFDEDFGPHAEFIESFDGATTATVLTAGYRPLGEGSATPMFHSSKPATTTIENGALAIDDSVIFSIGNSTPTTATNSGSSPSGVLDLSQQYTISFCVAEVPTPNTKKLQLYVDNNTTGSANSPHGAASRIFDIATSSLTPGQVVAVTSQVGSATSFVALRVESGTKVAVDNFMIEHGTVGSATCAGGGSSSSASTSSSSSSSSTSSSSSSSSSEPPGDAFDAALLPVGDVLPANMGQRTYSAPVGNFNFVAVPPTPVHIDHYQNLPADPTGGALSFELETAPFLGWGSWSELGPVIVTGGSNAAPNRIYTVFTKEQLIAALNEAGNEPKIIRVVGVIDFRFTNGVYQEYTSFDDQHHGGNVVIPSNTTLVGVNDANGNPARFAGTQIAIGREFSPPHSFTPTNPTPKTNYEAWVNNGQDPESYPGWTRNVIVRNLDIETPWDVNPGSADSEFDGIVVSWAQQVWIDHVSIGPGQYDGTYTATRRDGALDVVRGSNFVTISGSRFYTNDKTNLIGNSDSGRRWSDEGRLRVTLTGNHWTYNQARMPRVRYGRVHLYNNYFQGSTASVPNQKWGNGMAIGYEGDILADSNYFYVIGLKINASNEICGKLVHHHGGGSGFRGDNLWFRSDHASALTPVLVDSYLAGCNGLPLGAWTPVYAYSAVADPTTLEVSVPATAGAGKLQ